MEILKVSNLCKNFGRDDNVFNALKDINLSVNKGEFVMITGKSGSGKSTLIHILSGIDRPSSGSVIINNENIYELDDSSLSIFRRKNIGIVYQFYNLIYSLNVLDNITLPLRLDKRKINKRLIDKLIKTLDLKGVENNMINEISGGQMQRCSIGRALINRPKILFADEPTGNLDSKNAQKVMKLLEYYNRKYKQTIIMVTHDLSLAKRGSRNIVMKDGRIIKDVYRKVHIR